MTMCWKVDKGEVLKVIFKKSVHDLASERSVHRPFQRELMAITQSIWTLEQLAIAELTLWIVETRSSSLEIPSFLFCPHIIQKKESDRTNNHSVVKPSHLPPKRCRDGRGFWKQPQTELVMRERHIDYCFYYNRYWPVHQRGSADVCSPSNPTEFKHEKFRLKTPQVYIDTKDCWALKTE